MYHRASFRTELHIQRGPPKAKTPQKGRAIEIKM